MERDAIVFENYVCQKDPLRSGCYNVRDKKRFLIVGYVSWNMGVLSCEYPIGSGEVVYSIDFDMPIRSDFLSSYEEVYYLNRMVMGIEKKVKLEKAAEEEHIALKETLPAEEVSKEMAGQNQPFVMSAGN